VRAPVCVCVLVCLCSNAMHTAWRQAANALPQAHRFAERWRALAHALPATLRRSLLMRARMQGHNWARRLRSPQPNRRFADSCRAVCGNDGDGAGPQVIMMMLLLWLQHSSCCNMRCCSGVAVLVWLLPFSFFFFTRHVATAVNLAGDQKVAQT